MVIAAPMIVDGVVAAGGTQQQGFMLVGALFGRIGAIPLLLLGIFVREHTTAEQTEAIPFRETLQAAWQNIPFRYAAGMHMLNWSAVDMLSVAIPFFLVYWVAQGDMLASINFLGVNLAYESAFFGTLMLVCILFIPFWLWMARWRNKREAYMLGMIFWLVVQLMIFTIPPGDTGYLLVIAALAGIGVSSAYTLPDALFADVIEWDELRTRRRQEGIFYGIRTLIRKLTGALVIFVALQLDAAPLARPLPSPSPRSSTTTSGSVRRPSALPPPPRPRHLPGLLGLRRRRRLGDVGMHYLDPVQ